MSGERSSQQRIWEDLVESHRALLKALTEFLASDIDRTQLIRTALSQGQVPAVLYVAPYMRESERMELFPEWVNLVSCAHRHIAPARAVIHSLPQAWVVAHIDRVAEPLLAHGTEDEYWRFLEMYSELDRALTVRLINKALQHEDREIREAGEDFLEIVQDMR